MDVLRFLAPRELAAAKKIVQRLFSIAGDLNPVGEARLLECLQGQLDVIRIVFHQQDINDLPAAILGVTCAGGTGILLFVGNRAETEISKARASLLMLSSERLRAPLSTSEM